MTKEKRGWVSLGSCFKYRITNILRPWVLFYKLGLFLPCPAKPCRVQQLSLQQVSQLPCGSTLPAGCRCCCLHHRHHCHVCSGHNQHCQGTDESSSQQVWKSAYQTSWPLHSVTDFGCQTVLISQTNGAKAILVHPDYLNLMDRDASCVPPRCRGHFHASVDKAWLYLWGEPPDSFIFQDFLWSSLLRSHVGWYVIGR